MYLQVHKGVWRDRGIQRNMDHIFINTTWWAKEAFSYILPVLFILTKKNPKKRQTTTTKKPPNIKTEIYTSITRSLKHISLLNLTTHIPTVSECMPTLSSQVQLQLDPKYNLSSLWNELRRLQLLDQSTQAPKGWGVRIFRPTLHTTLL